MPLSAAAFESWRERKAYTLDSAAAALGISRRIVAYDEEGKKPIPRTSPSPPAPSTTLETENVAFAISQ